MPFRFDQSQTNEFGQRTRNIIVGLEHPDPLLDRLGFDLAQMWRNNIMAGPNSRWEAGPSKRAQKDGGPTLRDTSRMYQSIVGVNSGPGAVTVGSALTVGRGYNLLALHEFGVDTFVHVQPYARRQKSRDVFEEVDGKRRLKELGLALVDGGKGEGFLRHQHLPRRPTSPFDWDKEELLPDADALVRSRVGDYWVKLSQ